MVRQRRNGTAYIVSAFKEEIETQNVPPDLQTRLETLARQQGQLNSRFEKLARRLHERLGGFY